MSNSANNNPSSWTNSCCPMMMAMIDESNYDLNYVIGQSGSIYFTAETGGKINTG